MSNILIKPTSGSMGVEIHNVDLSKELSDSLFSEIRETFIAHGLILWFFPRGSGGDQPLISGQLIIFTPQEYESIGD